MTSYRDKQHAASRILAQEQARAQAADSFRRRRLDAALKKLLRLATAEKPNEPERPT
jgi:hypothetical protein